MGLEAGALLREKKKIEKYKDNGSSIKNFTVAIGILDVDVFIRR